MGFTRTPDNLRSQDTLEVVVALGEGPIVGLASGLKSFYIGGTPVQNPDNSFNFEDVQVDADPDFTTGNIKHPGLPEGQALPVEYLLGGSSNNNTVGVALEFNTPVARQSALASLTSLQIRIVVSALYRQDDNGIYSTDLKIRVRVKKNTDPSWDTPVRERIININGKTTSAYAKEIIIFQANQAPPLEPGEFWQIQLTKQTEDSDGSLLATDVSWESFQDITHDPGNLIYPDTALVHMVARASNQFSSIPEISGIYKGRIIRIPNNYDPVTREYDGVWDGTFSTAWTDNPAWILYDFVTNDRYGLSAAGTPVAMDKFAVYDAAQWCDGTVSDGVSGTEPRFTFNGVIDSPRPAQDQARYLAGIFGATIFDDGNNNLVLKVDRTADASHLFTQENITSEGFQYSMTDLTTWYNYITVSFLNPDLGWVEDRRIVKDDSSVTTYGRIPLDFIAQGCIKESEAIRRAYYKLNTALTEKIIVSFQTNRLGLIVEPFDIILIADPDLGYALSGRVKTVNVARTQVTLRDALSLSTGVTYTIKFRGADDDIISRTFTVATTGNNTVISFTPALPSNFPDRATFSVEQATGGIGTPKPFRVMKVEEGDNPDNVSITAVEVNTSKYGDSEDSVVSDGTTSSGTTDPANILPPTNVTFADFYDRSANSVWTVIEATLPHEQYAFYTGEFEVWSRKLVDDEPVGVFEKRDVFYGNTLIDHPPGPYEFKILPKNRFSQVAPLATMPVWEFTVGTKDEVGFPPGEIEDLQVIPTPTGVILVWSPPAGDQDYIHHYIIKEGADYDTATILSNTTTETQFSYELTQRTNTFWVTAVSISFVEGEPVSVEYENAAPAAPPNLTANVAYESILITFDRNTEIDIVGYRIQYREIGDPDYLDMRSDGVFDQGLPDTAYEFRAAALDALTLVLNDEVWSTPISVRTRNTLEVEQGFDDVQSATPVNLVRNGSFEKDDQYWTFSFGTVQTDAAAPYADPINGTSKILKLGNGTVAAGTAVTDRFIVRPGLQYTASFDLLKDVSDPGEAHYVTLRTYNASGVLISEFSNDRGKLFIEPEELDTAEWRRFSTTFQVEDTAYGAELVVVSQGAGLLYVDGVQVQRGPVATAFNPHVTEEISAEDLNLILTADIDPPSAPETLSASGAFRNIILTWVAPDNSDIAYYEVWRSTTNDRSNGAALARFSGTVFSDPISTTGVGYYYWVRAVDTSGNIGDFNAGNTAGTFAQTTPISSADIQNLSIVNALIADATIDNAKIASLSAAKITAGTITAGNIFLGGSTFELSGTNRNVVIKDEANTTRVKLGKLGSGITNYGIQIYSATGQLILGADGLGVQVVGTNNIANGAIVSDHLVANIISATHIASEAITVSKLAAGSVTASKLAAAAVTADKINVGTLSAITANLGDVTAGTLHAAGTLSTTNFWNLNTGEFRIGTPDGNYYLHLRPDIGAFEIQGSVTFASGALDYRNLSNLPQNLSDINEGDYDHLYSIQSGADVTATHTALNTTNVGNQSANNVASWAADPATRVNQQTTTINGGKITTGSITANKLDVAQLSAISATLGTVTTGKVQSGDGNSWLNFTGDGTKILKTAGFNIKADGTFEAISGTISGDLLVAGTITADKIVANGLSQYLEGRTIFQFTNQANWKLLVWIFDDQVVVTTAVNTNPNVGSLAIHRISGGVSVAQPVANMAIPRGGSIGPFFMTLPAGTIKLATSVNQIYPIGTAESAFTANTNPGRLLKIVMLIFKA